VADVGGGASPFSRADYVIDAVPFSSRGYGSDGNIHQKLEQTAPRYDESRWIQVDLCDHRPWPFPDKFFDFVNCSHLLEDVRDPIWICSEICRVGKAGYIETPSRIKDQSLGVENPRHAGYYHHRWLVSKNDQGGLDFRFKPHQLHGLNDAIVTRLPYWRKINPAHAIVWLEWQGSFSYREVLEFDEDKVVQELCDYAREARKITDLTVPDGRTFANHLRGWLYYQRLARGRR
jgi:SAM-dependent methyltransferase